MRHLLLPLAALLAATPALAASPQDIVRDYAAQARQESPSFKGFSAAAGERLYRAEGPKGTSCAACHTDSPLKAGRHERTGKPIAPLAPAADAERLTDAAKVEKWLGRNCRDVLGRSCSAQEKGDFLSYLLSVH